MALFLIERNYAEQLADFTKDGYLQVKDVNDELGIQWLFTFLSADKKKTYCLYEAANPDLLREQAQCLGIPADVIVEVTKQSPEMFA